MERGSVERGAWGVTEMANLKLQIAEEERAESSVTKTMWYSWQEAGGDEDGSGGRMPRLAAWVKALALHRFH